MSELSYSTDNMNATAQKMQKHVQDGQGYQYDFNQLLSEAQHLPQPLSDNMTTYVKAWDKHVQDLYKQLDALATKLHSGADNMQTTDQNNANSLKGKK